MKTKKLAVLTICVLLLVGSIGATLAWLTDYTQTVTNTFTVGNITINMDETNADDKLVGPIRDTENSYKMIPGFTIDKDPIIRITADSEPCWVFVELIKTNEFDKYMDYEVVAAWGEPLAISDRLVYAFKVEDPANYSSVSNGLHVLEGDQVVVKDTVTKEMMAEASSSYPNLTFKAYAVQLMKDNNTEFTAIEAWDVINN